MSDKEKENKEPFEDKKEEVQEEKKIPYSPVVDSLKEKFGEGIVDVDFFCDHHYVEVKKKVLQDAALFLKTSGDIKFDYLSCVTGLHNPKEEKPFEVIYSLYSTESKKDFHLRVKLAEEEKVISLFSVWQSADWFEREVYDLFGVEFEEHPNLVRIVLPEDWEGFPLRKDYPLEGPSEETESEEKEDA